MGSITRGIANNILGNGAVDGTDALSGTIPANNIANASLSNLTAFPPSVSAGIPQVASDPPSPTEGDIWYNTTAYKLKVRGLSIPAGTWASGGNRPAGVQGGTGFGSGSTSGLAATGNLYPSTVVTADVQTYDGSSWTEVGNVNTARKYLAASGGAPQTAGIIFAGGLNPGPGTRYTNAEVWNGSSWTETGDLNTARDNIRGAGASSTAALAFGGAPQTTYTEIWNGTSWTEVNDLNTAKANGAGFGTSTDAIAAGSDSPPPVSGVTESWNGTSWTEVNDLNTARSYSFGFGISTSGIVAGGNPDPIAATEFWNGTSWTEVADLGSARWAGNYQNGSSGTNGLVSGGIPAAPLTTATEEWNAPVGNLDVTLT